MPLESEVDENQWELAVENARVALADRMLSIVSFEERERFLRDALLSLVQSEGMGLVDFFIRAHRRAYLNDLLEGEGTAEGARGKLLYLKAKIQALDDLRRQLFYWPPVMSKDTFAEAEELLRSFHPQIPETWGKAADGKGG